MNKRQYITPEISTIEMDVQGSIMASSTASGGGIGLETNPWIDGETIVGGI